MGHPKVIAHRGASGHLPEHTVAAKCLAYGMGADFLEQDVIASRDGALVVLHDLHLDEVSDVRSRFPGRCRADGLNYAIDFDLAELKELRLHERRDPQTNILKYQGRYGGELDSFRVVTLTEEIELIQSLNRTAGRSVGIYPEIKDPAWHRRHGFDLTAAVVDVLQAYGYGTADSAAYLQSFERGELERVARDAVCQTPRVLLLEADEVAQIDRSTAGWAEVKAFASGVGLPYPSLLVASRTGGLASSGLAERLHGAGLEVHPYTLRRETAVREGVTLEALLEFLMDEIEVDALFCDQPDAALAVRSIAAPRLGGTG